MSNATAALPHAVQLDDRTKLRVSGVTDVIAFDEATIHAETAAGTLAIHGEGLHIERLNLEQGDLLVQGRVQALVYDDETGARRGWLGRLFG